MKKRRREVLGGLSHRGLSLRQNDDGASELQRERCPELGDMSSAAARRYCGNNSRGEGTH
jgi:hypothetical protein